jgi:lipopolysaccharide export system protein LptA
MIRTTASFMPRLLGALLFALACAGGARAQSAGPAPAAAQPAAPAAAQSVATPIATPAKGGKTPPEEEPSTLVVSDTLHYDDVKRESVFTGNVVATRGQLNLYADRLVVTEDQAGNQYGAATADKNKVVTITDDRPETFERVEGKGLRAEYDGQKQQFDLIGQAVVIRYVCGKPYDTIRGQRVRYYQKTDVYEAEGGPNSSAAGGRVRSLAEPRAKIQAAMDACRAAQPGAKPAAAASATQRPAAAKGSAAKAAPASAGKL